MRKSAQEIQNLVYVHLNAHDQYVLTYGVEFREFISSLSNSLNHLLLLKHQFNDGELNIHTLLEYVPQDRLGKLISADVSSFGEFCWVDFEEIEGLNVLSGQEIAELLYLGHLKRHLRLPFYNRLQNRFVYLAYDDGWFNKTYYRNLNDFYEVLGNVLAMKLSHFYGEKSLLSRRKKRIYPPVSYDILKSLTALMKEGTVFSLKKVGANRNRFEIPIRVIGDFSSMDDMYDEYKKVSREKWDLLLVFDKKTKEWKLETR